MRDTVFPQVRRHNSAVGRERYEERTLHPDEVLRFIIHSDRTAGRPTPLVNQASHDGACNGPRGPMHDTVVTHVRHQNSAVGRERYATRAIELLELAPFTMPSSHNGACSGAWGPMHDTVVLRVPHQNSAVGRECYANRAFELLELVPMTMPSSQDGDCTGGARGPTDKSVAHGAAGSSLSCLRLNIRGLEPK